MLPQAKEGTQYLQPSEVRRDNEGGLQIECDPAIP